MAGLGLIDYGMGNLHSVQMAFKRLETPLLLVKSPSDMNACQALILPGVGAFDPAMAHLDQACLIDPLRKWASQGKPLLGICLGLQLFFESSAEGTSEGLGLFNGRVELLPANQDERIPHMGWSQLHLQKICPLFSSKSVPLWMYFVHSYAAIPSNESFVAATTSFGTREITSVVWNGRLGACQFHPEKSSQAGHYMLKNWLNWLNSGAKPCP